MNNVRLDEVEKELPLTHEQIIEILLEMATKTKKQKSYIKHHYRGLKSQYDFLKSLFGELPDCEFTVIVHIISCQVFEYKKGNNGWVAIPAATIQKYCKGAKMLNLVDNGYLELKVIDELSQHTYSKTCGICRSYKVADNIVDEFINLGDISTQEYLDAKKVNLFTGKPTKKINKTIVKDDSNNYFPALIREAMLAINNCIIEIEPVEKHLANLKTNMDLLAWTEGMDSPEYITARGQYYNDRSCLNAALDQDAIEVLPGFLTFVPAYTPVSTGRIQTPLQNASREMKEAAFSNVENLKNYDLRSSQAIGLIQQFELAGLDTSWLERYKDNKKAKYEYSTQIGISVDTWKRCLCALLMGGSLPKRALEESSSSVMNYLMEEADGDFIQAAEYLSKFTEVVKPLKEQIDLWHNWLLEEYCLKIGTRVKGKLYIKNPTGITLCVDELPDGKQIWKRKSTIAAFFLQGQEAALIHNLTTLSLEYDYKVLQNEHDGLITIGIIPSEAVERASLMSNMKYVSLEEKPFV